MSPAKTGKVQEISFWKRGINLEESSVRSEGPLPPILVKGKEMLVQNLANNNHLKKIMPLKKSC